MPPLGTPLDPRHKPTVGFYGGAFSHRCGVYHALGGDAARVEQPRGHAHLVQGFAFRGSGLRFGVWGLGVSGLGGSGLGFRDWGLAVWGFWSRVSGLGFGVGCLGFGVWCLGFGV